MAAAKRGRQRSRDFQTEAHGRMRPQRGRRSTAVRVPGGGQQGERRGQFARPQASRERRQDFAHRQAPPLESEVLREDRLEGRNPVREALRAGRQVDKVWLLKPRDGRMDPALRQLAREAHEAGAVIMEVERQVLDRLSQTHNHQGVIAQVAAHEYVELEPLLDKLEDCGEAPFLLLLDEIQDPHNLGSILRIAEAAGCHAVVLPKRRALGLDAVVARVSAGAIEYVPCCRVANLKQCIRDLQERGIMVWGTSLEGAQIHSAVDLQGPLALVIGNEGEGIRPSVAKACDGLLKIPMRGRLNSLNAAVATGIVVFEAQRQRLCQKR